MASILPFSPRQGTPAKHHPAAGAAGQPAAIIIFPGVRYERRVDDSPTSGAAGATGRRRKRGTAAK